jgi:flagellin-like hook-associated protein FlgL
MKTKAEQAANDTLGTDERTAILTELTKMNDQIDAEKSQAKWSDVSLLNNAGSQNTLKFQIGEGVTSADSLSFNVAGAVFGGTASAFDSTGLGVTAGAAARNSSSAALSSTYTTQTLSTTSALGNATVGELASGHYSVEISSVKGAGSGATAQAAVTIKVRDAGGNLMTLDSDGAAGGASGTQMVRTLTAASTSGTVNLGNGVQIHLTGIATGAASAALMTMDYTKKGNAVDSQSNAQAFMSKIDAATTKISTALAYIGSLMNRLDYQASSVTVAKTNTEAAFNRIMNADMAAEQVNATKYSVLAQTATAMLGQANQRPQSILSLFR